MTNISGIGGPQEINPLGNKKSSAKSNRTPSSGGQSREDRVEISREGNLKSYLVDLKKVPDVRQDRIEQIKSQIENGTYVTEEKLNEALDGLIDDIL